MNLHQRLKDFEGSHRQLEAQLSHQARKNHVHVQEKVQLEVRGKWSRSRSHSPLPSLLLLQGLVSQSREKFERMAHEVEKKSQECKRKDFKLRQVHEVIRHSPLVRGTPMASAKSLAAERTNFGDHLSEKKPHKTPRDKENKDVSVCEECVRVCVLRPCLSPLECSHCEQGLPKTFTFRELAGTPA